MRRPRSGSVDVGIRTVPTQGFSAEDSVERRQVRLPPLFIEFRLGIKLLQLGVRLGEDEVHDVQHGV